MRTRIPACHMCSKDIAISTWNNPLYIQISFHFLLWSFPIEWTKRQNAINQLPCQGNLSRLNLFLSLRHSVYTFFFLSFHITRKFSICIYRWKGITRLSACVVDRCCSSKGRVRVYNDVKKGKKTLAKKLGNGRRKKKSPSPVSSITSWPLENGLRKKKKPLHTISPWCRSWRNQRPFYSPCCYNGLLKKPCSRQIMCII